MRGFNPVIHGDYPDPDVVRVGDAYYMSSTTMHVFPGAQILRSYDLLHREHCAYVYDTLNETEGQRMDGGQIYGKGMWASSLKYHQGLFHLVFMANDTGRAYHFTAEQAEGPWTRHPMAGFWHDPSLFFDDDGRVYIAHGHRTIRITEMTSDLSGPKEGGIDTIVATDDNPQLGWEGSHMLKHDGWYYVFNIHWAPGEMRSMGCFRSRRLDGGFEGGKFMELDLDGRCSGVAQGGPVQLHDGSWVLFIFQDRAAVGRTPVVVPFRWVDGWPVVDVIPKELDLPSSRPEHEYPPLYTNDDLRGGWSVMWQWNHEPHLDWVESDEHGLHITTERLASDCTEAINTLTQRCFGPRYTAEVAVDASALKVGDYAGICALQGCFSPLAITREKVGYALSLMTREDTKGMYAPGPITEPVQELARIPAPGSRLRLRADFGGDTVQLSYRDMDGTWRCVGKSHQLVYRLDHFMGCRVGLFVYSTREHGGSACFADFTCRVNN